MTCNAPTQALHEAVHAVSGGLHDVQRSCAGADSSCAWHAADRRRHAEDQCTSCSALVGASADQCRSCFGLARSCGEPVQVVQRACEAMQRTVRGMQRTCAGHAADHQSRALDQRMPCSGPVPARCGAARPSRRAVVVSSCTPASTRASRHRLRGRSGPLTCPPGRPTCPMGPMP